MNTQLVWTTWTPMSDIPKKAVKLNYSLTHLEFLWHFEHLNKIVIVNQILQITAFILQHYADYFWSKVNIWNVNCVRATAFIFDTGTGESVKVFETENVLTWGGLEPPTFGFMPNALTYWAIRVRHLLFHVFEYWLWHCGYFWSKVNIWNVNCARATALIFDTRTGVLVKVSKFLRQKMSRPDIWYI